MGKAFLRVVGRIMGLVVLLIALVYGAAKVAELQSGSFLLYYLLSGFLWLAFGFLIPFFTATHRVGLRMSLECFLCCMLCIGFALLISRWGGILPALLQSQSQLLQHLLLLLGGVFLNKTLFRVR